VLLRYKAAGPLTLFYTRLLTAKRSVRHARGGHGLNLPRLVISAVERDSAAVIPAKVRRVTGFAAAQNDCVEHDGWNSAPAIKVSTQNSGIESCGDWP
jgi:hypothetical protein